MSKENVENLNTTDANVKDIRTTDAVVEGSVTEPQVADETIEVKADELPKSWTDEERQQYAIVKGYIESVGKGDWIFEGVPDKVSKRAKRDAK